MNRPVFFTFVAVVVVAGAVGLGAAVLTRPGVPQPDDGGRSATRAAPLPDRAAHEQRVAAKDMVAQDVIAGRVGLPEAAALFGWLNDLPPAAEPIPQRMAVDAGLEPRTYDARELLLIQVVVWTEGCARVMFPARARDLNNRLRAQLRIALASPNRLPQVDSTTATSLLSRIRPDEFLYRPGKEVPPPPVDE